MHLTPFLTLVLVGYAVFMGALGVVWGRNAAHDMRLARAKLLERR